MKKKVIMKLEGQHLLFYDGTCGMCHRAVQFLLKNDKNNIFVFAPLQGKTAADLLKDWRIAFPNADTLVLVQNYCTDNPKIFAFGRGVLRTCWLLGGFWKIPGLISFLPSSLYDWIYKWVARHRFKWFEPKICLIPKTQDLNRFLP
jgi:predicted DCC family thiol-disulfide oxidoreductase YuxK